LLIRVVNLRQQQAQRARAFSKPGRQIRSDKRGAMPVTLEPLFERLGISTEMGVDGVVNFRKWFRSNVGRPKSMATAAETRGHNRAISISSARWAFK